MNSVLQSSRNSPKSLARQASAVDLDVGVIYSGERHFLVPLLNSMARAAGDLSVRIVLVDNASRDGVAGSLNWPGPVTVLHNRRRLGYAANLNRILAAATAPYVLLMNTDMAFDPAESCLSKMVQFMDHHPRCGVGVCRLFHPDGSEAYAARRFPTPAVIAARRLGLSHVLQSTLDAYLYRDRDPRASFECDWVSGSFMLVRREALADAGGFDERFRKYFEDVDFCARMWQAGWKVMYHGSTRCYHHEQRASRRLLSTDAWRHATSYLRWTLGLTKNRKSLNMPQIR
jgi:N-acetylglucosaminyl-diphospho-decaprenol L-rhamnosyltransferase